MKFQKSMMKIMENVFSNVKDEKSIESVITETKTGRNSAFSALIWLEKNGFIEIRKSGNQKLIRPIIDNHSLQFKYYLDSISFKLLDPFIKLVAGVLIFGFFKKPKIKFAVFFGSAASLKKYKDIDILLLGKDLDNNDLKSLYDLRDKIERLFGVVVNFHKGELVVDNLLKGIVVYQSSYLSFQNEMQKQYFEFLDWGLEAIRNQKDSKIFRTAFENAILNLSYSYCYLSNFFPKTKLDAMEFFNEKYKVKNLEELKKVGVEVGERLFK